MGTGIGIVASRVAGIAVHFVDPSEKQLLYSETMISKWCDKEIGKERMTQDQKKEVLGRITFGDSISQLSDVDFAVEAATENFKLKKAIFEELASSTPPHAILATNTSSISITKIAGVIPERAHQVVGMHFMNPVPVMKLIEVIKGL
jgi:3-hydroxybutyryl-CoA dehydrogenase